MSIDIKQKILICGDSFAADWSVKYQSQEGWPNLLKKNYNTTNVAQAGCSQYKIWLQISNANIDQFDKMIIWHTSPYRIPVDHHPLHFSDSLHAHCDLIYQDVKESTCPELQCVVDFYENFFNIEHAKFIHTLTTNHILEYLGKKFHKPILHLHNTDSDYKNYNFCSVEKETKKHKGFINHLSVQGNINVFNKVKNWIEQ
jgi:hypothetical protein